MQDKYIKQIEDYREKIKSTLHSFTKVKEFYKKEVMQAMEYSVLSSGKRLRPILTVEFCRMCGGNYENYYDIACCIELIHCFSLIHDDLPCMDNDDFRRGQPSCHKRFGEAEALLAGDALNTLPFEIITKAYNSGKISAETAVKLVGEISQATGINGMIGGQAFDIYSVKMKNFNIHNLNLLHDLKTCRLLEAACVMGCILSSADDKTTESARAFGKRLGYAFQIIDDILDVEGNFDDLGKPIGSDKENGKLTYVSLVGLDKAKEAARHQTLEALKILESFDNNELMVDLTADLLNRKK